MIKRNKPFKALCRLTAFLLVVLMLTSVIGVTASAEEIEVNPYDTYTYWTAPGGRGSTSSTAMYEFDRIVSAADLGLTAFKDPKDVVTDKNGNVYIMDSGNGRVVVLNPDYTLKTVIDNLTKDGAALNFTAAEGVFVTKDGKIYIADTENARVIVTNINKEVLDVLTLPDADVIPEDFIYAPCKIAIDSNGYTYILSKGSYYGALLYKPNGEFSGFYGSNSVKTSILGVFQKIYELFFLNDAKKASRVTKLPYSFTDITVDDSDFVYTSTGATAELSTSMGQLKKLSPGGTNILKDKTTSTVSSAESKNFSDTWGLSVLTVNSRKYRVTDMYTMDVDRDGYMYGFCRTMGHVFIYDQDCNLLSVFGGGVAGGNQEGTFTRGNSIQFNDKNNDILVIDNANLNLTVYKETEYGVCVKKAQKLTNSGSYVEAKPYWEQALEMDRNSQLAYRGLARAALIEEDYELCAEYAKLGFDQDTYASAFKYIRNGWLSDNFVWVFALAVLAIGGLIAFLIYSNKHKVKLIKNPKVEAMFHSVVHPFEGAGQIRYYGQGSAALATVCMVLFFLTSVISDMQYGFMYKMFDKSSYDVTFAIIRNFGLVLLWTVANWGMSTLFEGKGKMKDVYIVTCYALIPLIINNVALTVLSNVILPEEALILSAINFVCTALAIIMLSVGIMTVHEYGFFKFLVMTLIVVFAMLVVVFVLLMIFVLLQQLTGFVSTLYNEIIYR